MSTTDDFEIEYVPKTDTFRLSFGWIDGGISGEKSVIVNAEDAEEVAARLIHMAEFLVGAI
jgi:hypothetical protein